VGFDVGATVLVEGDGNSETGVIAGIGSIVLAAGLKNGYPAGSTVKLDPAVEPAVRAACDDYLVVSGSSEQSSKMGAYNQTGVMQYGRPVYEKSGLDTQYLYFWEPLGFWLIGTSYNDASAGVVSGGTGADATCPVDVPTWRQVVGGRLEAADSITVVAQLLASHVATAGAIDVACASLCVHARTQDTTQCTSRLTSCRSVCAADRDPVPFPAMPGASVEEHNDATQQAVKAMADAAAKLKACSEECGTSFQKCKEQARSGFQNCTEPCRVV